LCRCVSRCPLLQHGCTLSLLRIVSVDDDDKLGQAGDLPWEKRQHGKLAFLPLAFRAAAGLRARPFIISKRPRETDATSSALLKDLDNCFAIAWDIRRISVSTQSGKLSGMVEPMGSRDACASDWVLSDTGAAWVCVFLLTLFLPKHGTCYD